MFVNITIYSPFCIRTHFLLIIKIKDVNIRCIILLRIVRTLTFILSNCLFWDSISLPISTAMLRKFPIMPDTSLIFCSISSSLASWVILQRQKRDFVKHLINYNWFLITWYYNDTVSYQLKCNDIKETL